MVLATTEASGWEYCKVTFALSHTETKEGRKEAKNISIGKIKFNLG